jgi:hypothetical protein
LLKQRVPVLIARRTSDTSFLLSQRNQDAAARWDLRSGFDQFATGACDFAEEAIGGRLAVREQNGSLDRLAPLSRRDERNRKVDDLYDLRICN